MKLVNIEPCRPQEKEKWVAFLDQCFEYDPGQSFGTDFAPLFDDAALTHSRLIHAGGRIVSSATLYNVVAVAPPAKLNLGIIGAVATDPEFRGKGYSSQILNEMERLGRELKLDGLILWSDRSDHYSKLGYESVGRQQMFAADFVAPPKKVAAGSAEYGWDWNAVRQLYERNKVRILRSDRHWKNLERITSCTKVQWRDSNGDVSAYLGIDRGKDMRDVVHEWGGEPEGLESLLWTVRQARPALTWLTHPKIADPIRSRLSNSAEIIEGRLGLFKPLKEMDRAALNEIWFWGLDSL